MIARHCDPFGTLRKILKIDMCDFENILIISSQGPRPSTQKVEHVFEAPRVLLFEQAPEGALFCSTSHFALRVIILPPEDYVDNPAPRVMLGKQTSSFDYRQN